MKKRYSILFFLIFTFQYLNAQLYDKNWVMGHPVSTNYPLLHPFIVSFETSGIKFIPILSSMDHRYTNISMSDDNGNLQFYTNGAFINNHQHQLMENGNDILSPNFYLTSDNQYLGWRAYNCTESVTEKKIYYIYQNYLDKLDDLPLDSIGIDSNEVFTKLFVTKVDMNANNGLGKVVYKRKLVYDDQNFYQNTFVKHANGKDWWSILNHVNGKDYLVLEWKNDSLLSRRKFTFPDSSSQPYKNFSQGMGQKCFSRDGSLFIDLRATNEIRIFNFDRCNGIMSYNRRIEFIDNPNWIGQSLGVEISPNNRFLYLSRYDALSPQEGIKDYAYVSQINLLDPDPWKNKLILIDSFYDTEFEKKQNIVPWIFRYGIDGKLYFNSNGFKVPLYVIQNPNEKGSASNICDTCFIYPYLVDGTLPDFPNYRLGPLKGSPCDTILGVANKDIKPTDYSIKLFPNPSNSFIKIDITIPQYDPTIKTEVVLVDVSGAIVMRYVMPDFAYIAELDISKLPIGVYGVQLRQPEMSGTRVLATERLVVIN